MSNMPPKNANVLHHYSPAHTVILLRSVCETITREFAIDVMTRLIEVSTFNKLPLTREMQIMRDRASTRARASCKRTSPRYAGWMPMQMPDYVPTKLHICRESRRNALHIQNPYRATIADIIFREGGADITVKLRYFNGAAILGGLSDWGLHLHCYAHWAN